MQRAKHALIGLLCGAAAGAIVLGIGGRLMMRAISLLTGNSTEFSAGGSLEVIAFGAIIGSAAGTVYAIIERLLPGAVLAKGAIFGLLVMAALAVAQLPSVERSAAAFEQFTALIVSLFSLAFMVFGIVLAAVMKAASKRIEQTDRFKSVCQS